MKKAILFISLLLTVSLLGCNGAFHSTVEGDGNLIEKEFSVDEFSKVDASHAFVVEVTVGDETSVKIETDENLMKYVEVYVKNNTLYLNVENNVNIQGKMKAIISTPSLNRVDLSGACKIEVVGIESNKFSIDMSGACKGTFSGSTKKLDIDLSGATKLNTADLKAVDVTVDVSGASKCSVYSSESLSADASGASKIVIYGDPPKVKTDLSGASSISSN
ncbi:MAG: DUF2807 domain-containing protein [Melioribacteraceae bacterium]|nr:DUF2807 domain-containing protein [Melioribacteraceae bacterium]